MPATSEPYWHTLLPGSVLTWHGTYGFQALLADFVLLVSRVPQGPAVVRAISVNACLRHCCRAAAAVSNDAAVALGVVQQLEYRPCYVQVLMNG